MMNGARRYMSKSQRACDFCRSRRSACRIDIEPPCRQCNLHSRVCTFKEDSAPRKPRRTEPGTAELVSDGAVDLPEIHSPQDVLSFGTGYDQIDHVFDNDDQGHPDPAFVLDEGWPSADATSAEILPDGHQSEGSIHITADVTMDENVLDEFFSGIPANLDVDSGLHTLNDSFVQYSIGPTGEQDPNLLGRYRMSEQNEIWFKKLATRITSKGLEQTQFMLALPEPQIDLESRSTSSSPAVVQERVPLETIVPFEIGDRLIKL